MYKIDLLNNISEKGLRLFTDRYEYRTGVSEPDGILVRSKEMKDMTLPSSLKAIARAGAGVNNIPIDKCSEKGIVVFNTPGANANGVKELVILGMLLASRKVTEGIAWAKGLVGEGDKVPDLIEKGKSKFGGTEILGKKVGVVGLGAIGTMVANAAEGLGMEVIGYDPFLSIEAAWMLSRNTKRASSLEKLLADSDFVTLHVPLNKDTRGSIDADKFAIMKKGAVLLNFARRELVNTADLKKALADGIVSCYVTDFPDEELIKMDRSIAIPHLGASTEESEENCAIMAVMQLMEYLENGNIKNSVNFPETHLDRSPSKRLTIANQNLPGMIEKITHLLAENKINIADMINKSKGSIAYNIIDIDGDVNEGLIGKIGSLEGVLAIRVL
ncbi:MAG TPA: phosphoglycerate dehydrogenase [Deltaproteobacteria bacterium]|jgi:D-3-phosphoglycerate dehydrogenase|nr:phosphoglycerate dehydrogenase [Deltaproteobacteria bacterium]HOG84535.1 phosphoglycerate dehydrogenase [Deltaproteobacteria bacterium]HPA76167.1 phosphoglycerate dehydrogenase [Deltaproteobacteria bacterium]HPH51382.1 phosphoglycerate dehydrogenase [Deltaproteobacteria bacterium]HQO61147.1 phosphoglycerate dehydrogenase [Deltaproteobacteria bacterium]